MSKLLKDLCDLCGTSGREEKVREFIINEIKDYADYRVDNLGTLIVEKKGKKRAKVRVCADAHMDEVGIIVIAANERGFLKFNTVGGIEISALLSKRVVFENGARGVICVKPVHLCTSEEKSKLPDLSDLCIDVGAQTRAEALGKVSIGETAVFEPDYTEMGKLVCSKALDDRVGCNILIDLIKEDAEYDFTATFSTREEIGKGGAVAAYGSRCEAAVILESTTAADLPNNKGADRVTAVGEGAVLSFMDRATLYESKLYKEGRALAEKAGIKCQTKTKVAGGNNAGSFHIANGGVRTASISLPCRYLHSSSCVGSLDDMKECKNLARLLINKLAADEI